MMMGGPGEPAPDGAAAPVRSAGGGSSAELPEAAERRLRPGAWSSALSVADFSSCLSMGMEPIGYVQGCCVMQWSWYSSNYGPVTRMGGLSGGGLGRMGAVPVSNSDGSYGEEWRCPHGFVGNDHRMYGFNSEQVWVETAWSTGFGQAYQRMVDEASVLGAHGVIGVVDKMSPISHTGTMEFTIRGTAVKVPGSPRLDGPFTTFLSGQRLAKLFDAGFVPVSVVAAVSSVQMFGYCVTHYQMAGMASAAWSGGVGGVGSIDQVGRAQQASRHLAREHVRSQLGGDILHGATFEQSEHEIGEGDLAIQCTIRGTRVRQFADFGPLSPPHPVVRLS